MKFLVAAALLLASAGACAQGALLDRIKQQGEVTFGWVDGATPFSMKGDKGGEPQGYSVDLCRAVAESIRTQLGLQKLAVRWTELTLQNRLEAVRSGKVAVDCSTTTWTLTRQQTVDFSLITFLDGVSVLSKSTSELHKFADFEGKRIGAIKGTTAVGVLNDALKRRNLKAEVVIVSDRASAIKLMDEGKLDGLASDRIALIGSVLRDPGQTVFRMLDEDLSVEQYALALPRNDPDFRLAVNRGLARLYRGGEIATIYNKWLGPLGPPSVLLTATYFVQAIAE